MDEDLDNDKFIKMLRHNYGPASFDLESLMYNMLVVPVNFNTEHKGMLSYWQIYHENKIERLRSNNIREWQINREDRVRDLREAKHKKYLD